jgi:hypothetical protein
MAGRQRLTYTVGETLDFAKALGLAACLTPARCPGSMASDGGHRVRAVHPHIREHVPCDGGPGGTPPARPHALPNAA